ncbi:MAG: diaminopimelate epimerase [Halofilum sp. (in: g-proteobacteria)]|nr:diaminopimelate epimerase [Halofilum sp. (in: g-proteobacteria)]
MGLAFTKMHGLGNDFVVIDATRAPLELDAATVRHIADRHRGVGCDQLLLVEASGDADTDFGYRVYNADGGEVEQCGNGVRCVARYLRDRGLVHGDELTLASAGGPVRARLCDDGRVAVDMGPPHFAPAAIPFTAAAEADAYALEVEGRDHTIGAVSMGNPHAVLRDDDLDTAPVTTLGPLIEYHERFPRRANVGFMQVRDRAHVRLRVWERGVGETSACGTGACAAVAVGRRQGLLDARVRVELAGGELVIEWGGADNPVWMTGAAETVFEGTLAR